MLDKSNFWKLAETFTIVTIIVLGFRLISTYPYPVEFFGYDFGFYSYAVQHTHLSSITYFLGQRSEYGNHLFVILNWLRLPQVSSLIFLYYLLQVLTGIMVWLTLKRHSKLAAWLGLLFFSASVAQIHLHTMFLWKAVYGQLLLVTIFYFLSSKQWRWAIIPTLLLFITHKTTSAIFIVTLFIYSLVTFRNQRRVLFILEVTASVLTIAVIWYLNAQGFLESLRSTVNPAVSNGIFINVLDYLRYSWLLIPFAVFGIVRDFKKPQSLPWIILLSVSIVWMIAALPFYNRILQYADLAIIYFAALGIAQLPWSSKRKVAAIALVCILSITQFFLFRQTIEPQITEGEIHEIGKFTDEHPGAFVLSASALDAPWLLAYLYNDIRLAAPGLFEDTHSMEDWKRFWADPNTPDFLKQYPQPLYIYQRSNRIIRTGAECFNPVSENFYKYECNN